MKKINKRLIGISIILGSFILSGCSNEQANMKNKENKARVYSIEDKKENKEFSNERDIMALGTFINIKAFNGEKDNITKALDESISRIKEIENMVSVNIYGSDIDKINRNSGEKELVVSEETLELTERALYYSELSKGAFDLTIYPLVKLWGVGTENAKVPSKEEIEEKLKLIDYNNVHIDRDKMSILVEKENGGIDLGAIAKGYIGDEVKEIFLNYGITSGYLNLGGNVVVIGGKLDGSPWKIGVRNPYGENGEYFGILRVTDKTVVTSGNYERFLIENGKRYHHILDTESGYPVENSVVSTTIIAQKSEDGDGLSTATFVLGKDKGIELLESLEGVEGIVVMENREVYLTSGIKEKFKIIDNSFNKKNNNIQYQNEINESNSVEKEQIIIKNTVHKNNHTYEKKENDEVVKNEVKEIKNEFKKEEKNNEIETINQQEEKKEEQKKIEVVEQEKDELNIDNKDNDTRDENYKKLGNNVDEKEDTPKVIIVKKSEEVDGTSGATD